MLVSSLLEADLPVYPVNPKTVDRHRKASRAKTDAIDAYLLARTGRSDLADLRRLEPPAALELFRQLRQPSSLAFLESYPTPEAALGSTSRRSPPSWKRHGHPRPNQTAEHIMRKLREPHLKADAITTRTKARLMLALVSQLSPLLDQIRAYGEEIGRPFRSHPDSELFGSLPGAGKRPAPRLLAAWGDDRSRYASAASIQALAGTSPVAYQSGNYRKVRKRCGCVKAFRNTPRQFAWLSAREAWAEAYYRRKRAEGKSHSMALLALANIWIRIVHAMWLRHEPYDASTRPDPVAELSPREPWAGIRAEDASLPARVPGNPGTTAEVARRFSLFVVSVVSLASRNWPPIKTGPG